MQGPACGRPVPGHGPSLCGRASRASNVVRPRQSSLRVRADRSSSASAPPSASRMTANVSGFGAPACRAADAKAMGGRADAAAPCAPGACPSPRRSARLLDGGSARALAVAASRSGIGSCRPARMSSTEGSESASSWPCGLAVAALAPGTSSGRSLALRAMLAGCSPSQVALKLLGAAKLCSSLKAQARLVRACPGDSPVLDSGRWAAAGANWRVASPLPGAPPRGYCLATNIWTRPPPSCCVRIPRPPGLKLAKFPRPRVRWGGCPGQRRPESGS